jgi:hypothetical protein
LGEAMARNPAPLIIPCHRMLAAGGNIGGFSAPGGAQTKIRMLELEGVRLAPPSVVQRAFDFEASRLSASERFLRERFEGSPGSTNQRSQVRRDRREIAGASRLDRSISGDGRTSDFKFIQRSFSVHATFIRYHIDASG